MKNYHWPQIAKALAILLIMAPSYALAGGAPPPEEDPAAAEESPEAVEETVGVGNVDEFHLKKNTIVIVEPKKDMDPELASEMVLKYLQAGRTQWDSGDFAYAERYFSAALGMPIDIPEKETVLLTMGRLYAEEGMFPKASAILERLTREFPESRGLSDVYMDLGLLYRKMGALELAISKFYDVLNSLMNVSYDQLEKSKQLALRAKLEIAKTHHFREQFNEAIEMYKDLFRLELKPVERKLVHYEICHLHFELNNFQQAVTQLKLFIEQYPKSYHASEMRYLLAKSYEKLNRKPEALQEVVKILQRQSSPDTADPENADYWKQRTGNELANEFYEKGDFRSALMIYQSLARYNATPDWRWPAIHQIGLCFERLGLPEKAKLAYEQIVEPPEENTVDESTLSSGMLSLREMAKWRLDHLNWEDDLIARLHVLKSQ